MAGSGVSQPGRGPASTGSEPDRPSLPAGGTALPGTAVLVPVKAFRLAKQRLAETLDAADRVVLARRMAAAVVAAAAPLPASVVCDDDEVADWAQSVGATVLWRPGRGLNQAVHDGVTALAEKGYRRVVVAHADLPRAVSLAWVAVFPGLTIVPDRRDDGTNVLSLPTDSGFRFGYGAGSFRRHAAEGRRLRMAVRVVREPALGWDVDLPDDLQGLPLTVSSPP